MKSNMITSLVALIVGGIVGAFLLNNHGNLADSNRFEHYVTIFVLLNTTFILILKMRENKELKKEIERLKA